MELNEIRTLPDILAAHSPYLSAIGAPGRLNMSRELLKQTVAQVGGALRGRGIRLQDAVRRQKALHGIRFLGAEQSRYVFGAYRLAEKIALDFIAFIGAKELDLFGSFDAFGDYPQI